MMLLLAFLLSLVPVAKDRALMLTVSPLVSFAPATLAIRIRLQPQAEDRALQVGAFDADGFEMRHSAWTIDPEHCQKLYTLSWPRMDVGDYKVVARIVNGTGAVREEDSASVIIRGNGGER